MLKLDSLTFLSLSHANKISQKEKKKRENKRIKCVKSMDPPLNKHYVYLEDLAQVQRSPHEEAKCFPCLPFLKLLGVW